jgi:hypothetical protein
VAEELVTRGATLNQMSDSGWSAASFAAAGRREEMLQWCALMNHPTLSPTYTQPLSQLAQPGTCTFSHHPSHISTVPLCDLCELWALLRRSTFTHCPMPHTLKAHPPSAVPIPAPYSHPTVLHLLPSNYFRTPTCTTWRNTATYFVILALLLPD